MHWRKGFLSSKPSEKLNDSFPVERLELAREWVEVGTRYGPVRVKVAKDGGRTVGAHPEYDDCLVRAKANGVPVREVLDAALAAFRSMQG